MPVPLEFSELSASLRIDLVKSLMRLKNRWGNFDVLAEVSPHRSVSSGMVDESGDLAKDQRHKPLR